MGGGLIIAIITSSIIFLVPMINWVDSDENITPEVIEGMMFGITLFWFMITFFVWGAYIRITDWWEESDI